LRGKIRLRRGAAKALGLKKERGEDCVCRLEAAFAATNQARFEDSASADSRSLKNNDAHRRARPELVFLFI
jgi:hypothetical protein